MDSADAVMGCSERLIPDLGIFVEACICDTPLCNEKMGTIGTTTSDPNSSTRLIVSSINIFLYLTLFALRNAYNSST